jgi:hypothetical protein
MIVFAPSNPAPVFLDCTEKGSDPAQPVPLGLAGREALVLDEAAPRFVSIPEYPGGSSTISSHREVRILRGVDAAVKETLTVTGYYAAMLRKFLRAGDATARRTLITGQMNNRRAQLENLDISNLDQTRQPLTLELTYTVKRQFQDSGTQLLGQLPSLWEHRYLGVEPVDQRTTPFQIAYPLTFHTSVEIEAAGYAAPATKLFAQTVHETFVAARGSAESLPHGLKIQYDVDLPGGTFPPGQYGAYRDAMDKALRPLEQNLAFKRAGGPVQAP